MPYRYEKNGEVTDLVIDGFENGLADSALEGIADMRNLNPYYLPKATYVNYQRQLVSTPVDSKTATFTNTSANISTTLNVQKGDTVTFGSTVGNFTSGTKYWVVTSSAGVVTLSATIGGSAQVANAGGTATGTTYVMRPAYYGDTDNRGNFYVLDVAGNLWSNEKATTFSNSSPLYMTIIHWGTISSSGNNAQVQGLVYFVGCVIVINNNGSLDAYIAGSSIGSGYTASFNSYGANSVTAGATHYSIVNSDGIAYICNGSINFTVGGNAYNLATLSATASGDPTAITLSQTSFATFPEPQVYLSQLQFQLVVCGKKTLYFWTPPSTGFSSYLPITEDISSVTNIQNTLYILAGTKGSIYVCNGYSISLLKKIPDSMTDLNDPAWVFGGATPHRGKLIFGACNINQISSGTPVFGIFSLNIETNILNFENINSCGATIVKDASGFISNAWLLFDLNTIQTAVNESYDNYLSIWYNSPSGGADASDPQSDVPPFSSPPIPYSNYEPYFVTDLIPVGTALNPKTFQGQIEYKLTRPIVAGESLKIYYRTALGQAWTLIWTSTATGQISESNPTNFQQSQYIQFQVSFACVTSGSSFLPLSELRVR